MKRESFGSRLGFILVSAGCAIGIGNVWKFPYICGAYGGAAFILIYLCFLVILGIPVLVAEFAVGRGSHTSVAKCFDKLAPAGSGWKPLKFIGIIGMLIGPIALIVIKNIFSTFIDGGVVKTILDRN